MTFAQPWWLLGLALLPLVWVIAERGIGAVPRRQRRWASWVRSLLVAALVLALAGAALALPDDRLVTVFAIDASDSVGVTGRADAAAFVQQALDAKPEDALSGVVVFGGDARVEASVGENPGFDVVRTEPDAASTDIARALRLATALMPPGAQRRVVVLSDGVETLGDARVEAQSMAEQGVAVDVVEAAPAGGPDVAVLEVDVPSRVRRDEKIAIAVRLAANQPMQGTLIVTRDDEVVDRLRVSMPAGERTFSSEVIADEAGSMRIQAEFHAARDAVPENDTAAGLVLVSGRPRVLVVGDNPTDSRDLVSALRSRGFEIEVTRPSTFPTAEGLVDVDAVVLVDVAATSLTDLQVDTLRGYVRDLGRGLVTIGGQSSWSLGAYNGSPLEELLPLDSDLKDPRRRPSIAQVLAVDTSGSMAACHCNPEGGGARTEGGVNKTDISRSAAARAIEALTEHDEVGVLAFNSRSRWAIPLQQLPSEEVIEEGLSSLNPAGGTDIQQALREAVDELSTTDASLKHIVLFTDGFTNRRILPELGRMVREEGITLSVLATGEGSGRSLERMAAAGGGRFYPGRNLHEIPEILMNEVQLATRSYVNEGIFYPRITAATAATSSLESSPPLLGYIATSPKQSASVAMAIGRYDDPLLATWRAGLGVATSWTSDARSRWAQRWTSWNGFAGFWSDVVRETLPAAAQPGFSLDASSSAEGLVVRVESEGRFREAARGSARIVHPDGSTSTIELHRDGLQALEGIASAPQEGSYLVSVDVKEGETSVYRDSVGTVSSYSAEYRPSDPDEDLLADLARTTRGRLDVAPPAVWERGLPSGTRRIEIWPWLVALALALLPLDIALRRVHITREDLAEIRSRRARSPRTTEPVRTERLDRLFDAKSRARPKRVDPRDEPPETTRTPEPAEPRQPQPEAGTKETPEAAPREEPDPATGASALLRAKRARDREGG